MNVVDVPIENVRPYWRNPRKNEAAIQAVKDSIERYGFNVPLVLDMNGVIIAGHTRYKAVLELGWKTVPCVYSGMNAKKAKEYRIADNKTSELSMWDLSNLKLEVRELELIGGLPGFSESEINSLTSDITFGDIGGSGSILPDLDGDPVLGSVAAPPGRPIDGKEQGRFDRKEAELNSKFSDNSQKVQDNYVQVTCPHCAGEFVLDKREMG